MGFGFQSLLMGLENRSYKQNKQTIILYIFNIITCNYFLTHPFWLPRPVLRDGDTASVLSQGSRSSGSPLARQGGSCPVPSFIPGTISPATSSGPAYPVQLSLVFFIEYCWDLFVSNFHVTLMFYPFFSEILCLILFQFFNYKMKVMVSRIETEQSIKQSLSCIWPVGHWHLSWFFFPGETVFPTVFSTEPCKSCAWCAAGFATAAAQQRVVWCGAAATFGKVVGKDKKIGWFVPVWIGERRLWCDPKTLVGLQGCQDQTLHVIIYKVLK